MGVSENQGPQYRPPNSRALIRKTAKIGSLIFGSPHISSPECMRLDGEGPMRSPVGLTMRV